MVAPEEGQRVVGQRPDHGDAGRRAERKGGAGVGQQHDGFLGQLPAVSSFEKSHPGDTITVNYVENQSYKQKIQLAMGAGNAPTIFWTWGGGPLKQYIWAGTWSIA